MRRSLSSTGVLVVLVAGCVVAPAAAQLSKIPLWQNNRFDRLTLIDDKNYDVEPTRIPSEEHKKIEFKIDAPIQAGGQDIRGLPPFREINRQVLYRIRMIDDGQEYYVRGSSIRKIEYFEDMLLAEAKRLIAAKQFDDAHPYLAAIYNQSANWPGLFVTQVLYARDESIALTQRFEFAKALVSLIEEKRLRDEGAAKGMKLANEDEVGYLPVDQRIEELADRWIQGVLSRRDYDEARRIVARFEATVPNAAVSARYREQFAAMAAKEVADAETQVSAGKMHAAYVALDRAIRISPDAEIARSGYAKFFARHPVLKVGVERLSGFATGLTGWSSADWRCTQLLHLPLERIVPTTSGEKIESSVLEALESSGTNKEVTLRVKPGMVWPSDSKPATAVDVQRLLIDSCRPGSPFYHPAFARLVLGMEIQGSNALLIRFDRPQFRPGIWFQIPFVRLPLIDLAAEGATLGRSGQGPYRYASRSAEESVFDANAQYFDKGKPRIAAVVETPIPSSAERLRALELAKIDVSDYVPPRHLERAAKIPGVKVVRQSLPKIHVLQFNMSRLEFRNRTLRRAIAYAIDREGILSRLGVKLDKENCLVSGPLPVGSFGYDPTVQPRPYDPILARVLLHGVRRQFTSLPTFRMSISGTETERTAALEIVKNLERIGLKVTVIDYEGSVSADPLEGDIKYMSYTVTDPVYDVATLVTRANPSLAVNASTWLRDKMVQLVQVPNLSAATRILPEIHRLLDDDVALVPLWQLVDHFAVAATVEGLPASSSGVYSGVADWTVKPRYPPAYWNAAEPSKVAAGSELNQGGRN